MFPLLRCATKLRFSKSKLYSKIYHPNNAALGLATMRSGVSHWQAGLIDVGHGMICKAYAILMVTHGPTHPITQDLEVSPAEKW